MNSGDTADGDEEEDGGKDDWDVTQVRQIQQGARAEMKRCVDGGEVTWDTVVMTCDCVAAEQEEGEAKLERLMARSRRRDVDGYVVGWE